MSIFENIKEIIRDRPVILLSTGPSLDDYPEHVIRDFANSSNAFVVCVKSSFIRYADICDLLICSKFETVFDQLIQKLTNMKIKNKNITTIYLEPTHPQSFNDRTGEVIIKNRSFPYSSLFDHIMYIDSARPNLHQKGEKAIMEFDPRDHTLNKREVRPFIPGILFECVFYVLEHIGAKQIYTLGWDQNYSGSRGHYYEKNNQGIYNHAAEQEKHTVHRIVSKFYDWFVEIGIKVIILSKYSKVDSRFERKNIYTVR